MKLIIAAAIVGLIPILSYHNISFAAETKTVCVEKRDAQGKVVKKADGTVVQDCKEIKVHQKLEGTKVPEKK